MPNQNGQPVLLLLTTAIGPAPGLASLPAARALWAPLPTLCTVSNVCTAVGTTVLYYYGFTSRLHVATGKSHHRSWCRVAAPQNNECFNARSLDSLATRSNSLPSEASFTHKFIRRTLGQLFSGNEGSSHPDSMFRAHCSKNIFSWVFSVKPIKLLCCSQAETCIPLTKHVAPEHLGVSAAQCSINSPGSIKVVWPEAKQMCHMLPSKRNISKCGLSCRWQ